ncbi:HlyC/CorC family transporter [Candidatus Peregrinibacteria bacterium CG10_big_fil_rev_8_21_14_0_10_54_7]|nr:MAG: HlyC/CorC family transporter [Candidatus Peregrinibacteria bacterium CG10_big_fil_rev_8_21_14_0_10_54_7]
MTSLIVLIAGILLLSGFLSGAEAALISVTEAEIEAFLQEGKPGWKLLKRLKRQLHESVIAIIILNNAVNIVGSILMGQMVIRLYGNAMLAVATTALTFGIIVFSDIFPKSIGIHYAPRVAPFVAPVIWFLTLLLFPPIVFLEWCTSFFRRGERRVGTEAQIRALVRIGRKTGYIESDEGQLIHRVFILNDRTAADIMTPLKDIVGIAGNATIREAADIVFRSAHSRYPVFGASLHEVRGIAMSHDILAALAEGKDKQPISTLVRECLVVGAHERGDDLLFLFRDRRMHLAVVQEQGKTVGLVTLEDVLEELVGEIDDEMDAKDG